MQRLHLTLDTPAENIALDEALLDTAEATAPEAEYLRLWESPTPLVVLGRSSRAHEEVDLAGCERRGIPVLRRSSGGATIVAGPGCLMYAVVLSYTARPTAHGIHNSHTYVLDRIVSALQQHEPRVTRAGTSDIVIRDDTARCTDPDLTTARKFSGNSLRVKRTHFLYHGTLLYNFDLALVPTLLRHAPRQPDYRQERNHADFITNLPLTRTQLASALTTTWRTTGELKDWPREQTAALVRERYTNQGWTFGYGTIPKR
jgi:lipoate---protein ligase